MSEKELLARDAKRNIAAEIRRGMKAVRTGPSAFHDLSDAVEAVLENTRWLTASEIGERGKFSPRNLPAVANRWKRAGKLFAIPYQGQNRYPRYALDDRFRPIPCLESILKLFGPISPWRIAVWFDSTNAWLQNRRPRELLGIEPDSVLRAAEHYKNSSHG